MRVALAKTTKQNKVNGTSNGKAKGTEERNGLEKLARSLISKGYLGNSMKHKGFAARMRIRTGRFRGIASVVSFRFRPAVESLLYGRQEGLL
jgi:hypothetical protein